jgi:hypothetical protein
MVYEQFHRLDFNQQVNQPVTAYGQVLTFDILEEEKDRFIYQPPRQDQPPRARAAVRVYDSRFAG